VRRAAARKNPAGGQPVAQLVFVGGYWKYHAHIEGFACGLVFLAKTD